MACVFLPEYWLSVVHGAPVTDGMTLMSDGQWAIDVLLPHRPHATDDLSAGQRRMSRESALLMRYIEHSPHALLGAVVVDCDHPDAAIRAFQKPSDHPQPSWVAQSPSGRAHLGWWLAAPVCRTDSARLQPLRLAQRVEAGLRTSVGGDLSYGGQLTKNPIHPDWETLYGPGRAYSLAELVTIHTPTRMPRRTDRAAGLGRNVTMFDTARQWGYQAWRSYHLHEQPVERWEQAMLQRCHAINSEFSAPLPFAEVKATAQSISRWIWRNFSWEDFVAIQSRRGRKGGLATGPTKARNVRKVDRAAVALFAAGGQADGS
jgi:hypothetical protein